ncbi:MAG: metal-dependent transcriptional regulator [Myxococcota bacterium]|nr:metal-dependent transcriptional regulator [Myxococcota bacterium]
MAEAGRAAVPSGPPQSLTEELMELIWTLRERGVGGVSVAAPETALRDEALHGQEQENLHGRMAEALADAEARGWIDRSGEEVRLTPAGEDHARRLVRRHRLAEQLFFVVLDVGGEASERHACLLEHLLSPEVTDSVCAFLGHPRECFHGRPIPPGPCCERPEAEMEPLVVPLPRLPIGAPARVVFVSSRRHARVDRLAALGLIPGATLRLHQRLPGYVVALGETTLALDTDIAGEIYVRRA